MKSEKKPGKQQQSENFLDYIPVHSQKFRAETTDDGHVTIFVENKGLFNRIAQAVFKKPVFSQVHLEEYGNFIWPLIDGNRSVKEIADQVHDHFGQKAEPLYPRISMYFKTLKEYGFVEFTK